MSLNDSHMLPDRVRNMRQMQDVLMVEDIILAELDNIIDEMYQRASVLHEELVNEPWLETKLSERTGAAVNVTGYAEQLLVEIILSVSESIVLDMRDVRAFLDKWLPAHLKYKLNDRMTATIENIFLNGIRLFRVYSYIKIPFLPFRSYDGTSYYNGMTRYDAKRKYNLGVEMRLHFGVKTSGEEISNMAIETRRNVQYYNGKKRYDGKTKYNSFIRKDVIE